MKYAGKRPCCRSENPRNLQQKAAAGEIRRHCRDRKEHPTRWLNWGAAKELKLSYYNMETLFVTNIYPYYGNLMKVP